MKRRSGWVGWFAKRLPTTSFLSLGLQLAILLSLVQGLAGILPDLDIPLLYSIVILSVFLTWLLAATRSPDWLAGLFLPATGVLGIFIHMGRLWNLLALSLFEVFRLAWKTTLPRIGTGYPPFPDDLQWLVFYLSKLAEGTNGLFTRLLDWLGQLSRGQPAFDPIASTTIWCIALWLVAAWAIWFVRRYNRVLIGLLPAGALLAANLDYTYAEPGYFILFLGLAVLLQSLHSYQANLRLWQSTRLELGDVWFETGLATLIITCLLMLVAALTPALSVKEVALAAQHILSGQSDQEQRLADSLGLHSQPGAGYALENAHVGGLPNIRLLGSDPELSQRVVMVIAIQGFNPISPADLKGQAPPIPPRYYWRSLTYDLYSGRGWYTQSTQTVAYKGGEPLPGEAISANRSNHQAVRQEIHPLQNLAGLVYVTGELTILYRDYQVAWRGPADALGAQTEASDYVADSLVPVVTEEQLRQAGSEYPPWIRERYLYLPDSVPERIRQLALDLTATAPTPYDRAQAIESYLRKLPYTLDLSDPPPGVDVTDYFLFVLKRGYCDYFATAMVVLSRSAGLPTRFVTGYASGNYDVPNGRFTITEANAHSWTEVYFPGVGWVEFEPTSSRPVIERPGQTDQTRLADLPPLEPSPDQVVEVTSSQPQFPVAFILLFSCVLFVMGWIVFDTWKLNMMSPPLAVANLYRRLFRGGRWLAQSFDISVTPLEFQMKLNDRLESLAGWQWLKPMADHVVQDVQQLTQLYIKTVYSPRPITTQEKTSAIEAWRRLRSRLWWGFMWLTLLNIPHRSSYIPSPQEP